MSGAWVGSIGPVFDGLNNRTSFAWDPAAQTATVTDARGGVWKDVYASNVLQKRVDPLGNQTTFGTSTSLDRTSVTGPDGQQTTMSYDARGNLLTATAPASLNAQKTFSYDAKNNVTSVTDARGKVTTYGYDAAGNTTSVTQDGQTVATSTYDAAGRFLTSTDGRGSTTTSTYDTSGNLASLTDPLGNKTTYGYDAAGRLSSRVDPLGNVAGADPNLYKTTWTYDGAGRVLTESDPLGNTTTSSYDGAGNKLTETDARGKVTTYGYDAANRLTTVTAPDGGVTTSSYDAVGNKLSETDPRNNATTYTYDQDNRLASVTTPLGNKTTYSYDGNGNQTKVVEPRGNVTGANPDDYATTSSYDAAGRLLTETDPLGHTTSYVYDKVGNRTSVSDANSHTTSWAYDGRNRLSSVTAPGGAVTSYAYDGNGNLLTRTDANNHVTSYEYDAANRQTAMTLPLNRVWTHGYDANGNLKTTVDANGNATPAAGDGQTSYVYDRANRLTTIDYSDSTPDVSFAYDAVGNRTQMSDGAGSETRTYDPVNRLKPVSRGSDTFSYDYDLAGNISRRTYPDSTVVDYGYDADERTASVASGGNTTTYAYDAAGDPTTTTLPASNGYVETRSYDRAGRLVDLKNAKGVSVLSEFAYTLDPVGNPTQVIRTGTLPGTTTYAYDIRDRLTEACFQTSCPGASDPFIRWNYDPVGNRLTEARPSGTTTYTYDAADELTQAGATAYGYDSNGNETSAGTRTFGYDLDNRLVTTTSGATTTSYTYDGDGNRLRASIAGQQTNYLWDTSEGLPQLTLERDGNNALLRRYVNGRRHVSMTTGGNTFYYAYDGFGSVANATASNGATEWTYAFEPFGATRTETQDDPSAPVNVMKFVGELADTTGLYYLRARQYEPANGRFLGLDPLQRSDRQAQISKYIYADDQPSVLADPSGQGAIAFGSPGSRAADAVLTPEIINSLVPEGGECRIQTLPQREQCAFDFFWANLTGPQSAGVVGNLWYESGRDLNPKQWQFGCNDHSWHDSRCGVGIAQWTTKERKEGLLAFAAGRVDFALDFQVQIAYVWHELVTGNGPRYSDALSKLQAIKGSDRRAVYAATTTFMRRYEGPDETPPADPGLSVRQAHAWQVFRTYG